jgi:hypothetical protein
MSYTVGTLLDEANLLRDSLLVTLECEHFEAYVHVIMWRVVFKELRGLTNSKGLEISPTELINILYEYLYDLGTMLQTTQCMTIFKDGYRPWPHVYKPGGKSKKFYNRMDANLQADLVRLLTYEKTRSDSEVYGSILKEVLGLFGKGILDSLEFTMKDYIKQTDDQLSNGKRATWELEAVKGMLCHNNHAERPFAVLRAFAKMYPALSLRNLAWLCHHSLVNGTHRPARTFGTDKDKHGNNLHVAEIAVMAHKNLKRAVNAVCSVR